MSLLPVASRRRVRRETVRVLLRHRGGFAVTVALYAGSAVAGLAGPWLLGRLVDGVVRGTGTAAAVDRTVALLAAALLLQTVLAWFAARSGTVLGETVFADLREQFMARVARLPLSVVERAGSGDLVARTTRDVEAISYSVRFAVPRILVASVALTATLVALLLSGPLVAAAGLVALPVLLPAVWWYLRRARAGYLREISSYATVAGTVTETLDAARTVAAQRLQAVRRRRLDDDLGEVYAAERYTLWLRSVWVPAMEFSYVAPVCAIVGWGGWLVLHDQATPGQVTTVALYALQLVTPLDDLLAWLDELQVGAASMARIIGVGEVGPDRTAGAARPDGEELRAGDVRYAYRRGHDVLHGIDLELRPGERLAVVGPSGAGKSTLGRLLAGVHPPRTGAVTVGGVPLVALPLEELRTRVALVTQEQHVFVGTLAENLRLAAGHATDEDLLAALGAVAATGWARALPDGLGTAVGSGGHPLTPAQAQQLALARLVLADPHTLVLDEATSLLDPRAARHLERSLSAVLAGRTVVAVAHRLHTAHDADRVAVVEGGRITEIGTHAELVALDGSYAALWRSWRDDPVRTA